MMTVYSVWNGGCEEEQYATTYHRNLRDAEIALAETDFGYITRYRILSPVTKDTVILLLNQAGFASNVEIIMRKLPAQEVTP